MAYRIYNFLLILASPVILILLGRHKRSQRGIWNRVRGIPSAFRECSQQGIWVHAVSLGEVVSVVPLLQMVKARHPSIPIVVSTVTETGREIVLERLEGVASHVYAPLDYWWAVERFVRYLRPKLFILVESEFWPNLLKTLHRHQVPVCLVNGRISTKSFSRYVWIHTFMQQVLGYVDLALMQSSHDAERIRTLGVKASSIHVLGNIKIDQGGSHLSPSNPQVEVMREEFGLKPDEFVIVAGSTHPKEEEDILWVYRELLSANPHVVLVMAPRHIERSGMVEEAIQQFGFVCKRRSLMGKGVSTEDKARVILLDTRGELVHVYGLGHVGFVGGTLVPVGGHNLLEPAQWGRPVLFGPHIDHCRDSARMLLEAVGAIQVKDRQELRMHLNGLIQDPQKAEAMGSRAQVAIQSHQGVTVETLRYLTPYLQSPNC